jgi:hypothetical protein
MVQATTDRNTGAIGMNPLILLLASAIVIIAGGIVLYKVKPMPCELDAKLAELRNKHFAQVTQSTIPGTYRVYNEGNCTHLVIADYSNIIHYVYDEDGGQMGVNYENRKANDDHKLSGKSSTSP